ncbi:ion channel regulatory protein UNC-93 [Gregarina niphandrodes]|uniref:Ion channel regulatory protein UNC-93 n=1 Tax=Gregarina niphandrodes TaxID=110365 RepID=A0A023B1K3_GRENI|nr:ion channel regulatory protein UNC-93 [Gregarina niphandrodes]EZG48221.1 ion channel regulatory protein UNC-93 [Gregarina niphandrodes]|eukprot:XP_011132117.1 ion channel regulatory protein UNC-93 [Gregarina niphandrodes]
MYQSRFQIVFFTITMLGVVGSFNGLNALGKKYKHVFDFVRDSIVASGGGQSDHMTSTKIQTIYNLTLAVCGWLGGRVFNTLGPRLTVTISGLCYGVYVAAIIGVNYCHWNRYLVYPAGIMIGLGASLMWTVFGVMSFAYPVNRQQAFLFLWTCLNLGSFALGCCGMIQRPSNASGLSLVSYLVILSVMMLCTGGAAILLKPLSKIKRSDGTIVGEATTSGHDKPLTIAEAVADEWPILALMLPMFLSPNSHYAFLFNGLNAQYFNVRSRSLNTAIYSGVRIPGSLAILQLFKKASTTMAGIYVTALITGSTFLVAHITIFNTFGNVNPKPDPKRIDAFTERYHAFLLIACFINFGLLDSVSQTLMYVVLGRLSGNDVRKTAIYSGLYKGIQAIGVSLYWGLDWMLTDMAIDKFSRYRIHWLSLTLQWCVAIPTALVALLLFHKHVMCRVCGSEQVSKPLCNDCRCLYEKTCGSCDACLITEKLSLAD